MNRKFMSVLLSFALLISFLNFDYADAAARLVVSFIDVGQGNATLIQFKGRNIIIDTGTEDEYSKLKAFLDSKNVRTIHNMILSHDDSDHMGAADLLIRDYNVRKVTRAKYRTAKDTYDVKELNSAIRRNGIDVKKVQDGDKLYFGAGITATVLSPATKYEETNQQSVVVKLDYRNRSFMFTGDIDAKIEGIIRLSHDVDVDVLQIAHHGSGYSSSMMWLNDTSPKYAVISVGADNSYGHPDKTVVKRIAHFAEETYRTDLNGNITFITNGNSLSVKTSRSGSSSSSNSSSSSSSNSSSGSNSSSSSSSSSSSASTSTSNGRVIGNVNSHIYHNKHCSFLPDKDNRVYFKNRNAAKHAGYRACKVCGG